MAYDREKSQKRYAMGLDKLQIDISAELKQAVGEAADRGDMPMNEFVAGILAKAVGRPELGVIPRKRPGRPRKSLASV